MPVRLLGFLLLCCVQTINSVYAISIDVNPQSSSVEIGNALSVDLVVSGLSADSEIVSAYDIFVSYDAAILSAVGVVFGSSLDDAFFPSIQFDDLSMPGSVELGEISFLLDNELAPVQGDSIVLATLIFDTLSEGESDLLFEPHPFFGVIDIKGRNADMLPVSAGPGLVTVFDRTLPVAEPGSIFMLLFGLCLYFLLPIHHTIRL